MRVVNCALKSKHLQPILQSLHILLHPCTVDDLTTDILLDMTSEFQRTDCHQGILKLLAVINADKDKGYAVHTGWS